MTTQISGTNGIDTPDIEQGGIPTLQVAQLLYASIGTRVIIAGSAIPADNTIPQSNEGDEVLSLAITPKHAGSKLVIELVVAGLGSTSGGAALVSALFKDAETDARAVVSNNAPTTGYMMTQTIKYVMTAGSTSAMTFKIRVGGTAGTIAINGSNASYYGGSFCTSITITEYLP